MSAMGPLEAKSYAFALKLTLICQNIVSEKREYVLTKQCIKSSTSVGANIAEAQQSESRRDFISKFSISMKEGYETRYWIYLLRDTDLISIVLANELLEELDQIIAMLGSSIRTAKKNLKTTNMYPKTH